MQFKTILVVFGTRPEAIKMCPLIIELRKRSCFRVVVCVTGQHRQMLDQVLNSFGIIPDYDLSLMKPDQTLSMITTAALEGMSDVLLSAQPDIVLVHGDTTTSFAAALSAFYKHIPIGHVEAGLRTYDMSSPFPEEFNRQVVDLISQYYFAPTKQSRENLLKEGRQADRIYITGNTSIDALRVTVRDDYTHSELDWAEGSKLILVTAHRRENLGEPMVHMFRAIKRITETYEDVKVIYPIHLNPAIRDIAARELSDCNQIHLINPLDVLDFHNFLARSYLVLTDSGGIQEEAPSLGKPVLVMRNTTERPEGVAAGTLKLVGTDEDRIFFECADLISNPSHYEKMSRASNPYGDGTASRTIANILEDTLF